MKWISSAVIFNILTSLVGLVLLNLLFWVFWVAQAISDGLSEVERPLYGQTQI